MLTNYNYDIIGANLTQEVAELPKEFVQVDS